MQLNSFNQLDKIGLNLQIVFEIDSLPQNLKQNLSLTVEQLDSFEQLLLIAHAGKEFWLQMKKWQAEKVSRQTLSDPIDSFSHTKVEEFLSNQQSVEQFHFVYPGANPINLQAFGKLAGWHFDSPLRVGINDKWGTWFAYRTAVLISGELEIPRKQNFEGVCSRCSTNECISACPANALSFSKYDIQTCIDYRLSEDSDCKDKCIARLACPIARNHQYTKQQVNYHYERSFRTIQKLSY